MKPSTLFDKLWRAHVVRELGDGWALLHIDRHLLHEMSGAPALTELMERGLPLRNPELTFATADHILSTAPGRRGDSYAPGAKLWRSLRTHCESLGIRHFDLDSGEQGIVHVIGPALGLTLPGATVVCGDSHTCTHGALGALAFGIGSTEIVHVLATQTLAQRKPRNMRLRFDGAPGTGVGAKDLILSAIGRYGADAGSDYAVEYAGDAISRMGMEARLTLCNLSIEFGAKYGFIAPDDTCIEWIAGRPHAPHGADFERAAAAWRQLRSDDDARFEREECIDASRVAPTITWGTSPEHAMPVDGVIPDPAHADAATAAAWRKALDYMALEPGRPIAGTPIDFVFIGSCTNSRLDDLRAAAAVVGGRKVAPRVEAWVVPGSAAVKRAAEAEGLASLFTAAGFQWREPGCSLCVAANGERVPAGARAVSTSNRNFVGRQGPGARTHLASPAMAAAAAIAGKIVDVRCSA